MIKWRFCVTFKTWLYMKFGKNHIDSRIIRMEEEKLGLIKKFVNLLRIIRNLILYTPTQKVAF